jgi:hypothetical protein
MIDTLYVNGCSWSSGNELEEDPKFVAYIETLGLRKQDASDFFNWNLVDASGRLISTYDEHYNKFNWPGELQRILKIPNLVNHAIGASSNRRILRNTLEYVRSCTPRQLKKLLIVIGWTDSTRNELYVNNSWQRFNLTQSFSSTYDYDSASQLSTEQLKQIDKMQELFTVCTDSEYMGVYDYFNSVYLLANTLSNLKVKYMFFNALPPWWTAGDLKTNFDVENLFVQEIKHHNEHNNIMHYKDSMFDFVNRNNYPVAKYLHPLCLAHTDWAKHLNNELKDRNIL